MNRRHVLKSGAKLAYATPLVAASMKLESRSTFAISGGPGECSHLDTTCTKGVFDEAHGQCMAQPINEDFCCGGSGFRCTNGQCIHHVCKAGFQNVAGICVPYAPGECVNGNCECGFYEVAGICIPLPDCF
jgi:hypothetical protein